MNEDIQKQVSDNYDLHLAIVLRRLGHLSQPLVVAAWMDENIIRSKKNSDSP